MIVLMFFCIVVFKLISTCKSIFKVDIKTLILPQLTSLWCLYYNTGRRFYLLYVLEESEVVPCKGSIKNVFLKIPQNSQENICAKVSNKAAGWSPATLLNTESGLGAFLWIVRNLEEHLFCRHLKGLPLKGNIFSGVSFLKILGFTITETDISFTMKELRHLFPWKFLNV